MAIFSRVARSLNLAIPPFRGFAERLLMLSRLLFSQLWLHLLHGSFCCESWWFRLPTHNIFVSLRMSLSRPQIHSSHFPKGESFWRIVRTHSTKGFLSSPLHSSSIQGFPLCFILSILLESDGELGEHLLWGNRLCNPWSLKWFSIGNLNSCFM